MKLLALLLALLFFVAGCSNSVDSSKISEDEIPALEWTWVPFDSDALQVSGRASYERSDCLILSWSATSITIAFVGTALELKSLSNSVVYLDVFVDGEEIPSSFVKISDYVDGPTMVPVVSDLRYGSHFVTLYKRSESYMGDWYVYGMNVLGVVRRDLLPHKPERKIEFVGNSITCGNDVLVPAVGMDFDPFYESSYYSYAGQTARILNAEANIICSSGHGVYINNDGTNVLTLPVVYNGFYAHSPVVVEWDHSLWHPDIVVINLGTNDFASGKNDSTQFVNVSVDFVRNIRTYHPEAKIVLLDGPMLTGEYMVKCRQYLDAVKAALEDEGLKDLYRFSFEPRGESLVGFNPHPVKEEALADAESLSAWIRSEFGWD
jgi:hypothetical protein